MKWPRGQQAFNGTTSGEIREAILNARPPPARSLNPAIDLRLQAIIEKALEKDRDVRYQHASDLRTDLKQLRRDSDSGNAVAAMSESPAVVVGTSPLQHDTSDSQFIAIMEKRHRKSFLALMAGAFVIVAALLYALYQVLSMRPLCPQCPPPWKYALDDQRGYPRASGDHPRREICGLRSRYLGSPPDPNHLVEATGYGQ